MGIWVQTLSGRRLELPFSAGVWTGAGFPQRGGGMACDDRPWNPWKRTVGMNFTFQTHLPARKRSAIERFWYYDPQNRRGVAHVCGPTTREIPGDRETAICPVRGSQARPRGSPKYPVSAHKRPTLGRGVFGEPAALEHPRNRFWGHQAPTLQTRNPCPASTGRLSTPQRCAGVQ